VIVFSHIRNTGNTGDLESCPALYFKFPGEVRVQNYDQPISECKAVIYGGGTMTNWLMGRREVATARQAKRIGWGIGSSRHSKVDPWPDPELDLTGIREWSAERQQRGEYVPCASCMHPLFDESYTVEHDAVLFTNAAANIKTRHPVGNLGLPHMENDQPIKDVLTFLGSGNVVVTNSYHGVYWGTLLRRQVVCIPYSSKFYNFKYPPAYSINHGGDWQKQATGARQFTEALEDSRAANRKFHDRVMETITV
jgi:hypothetical protein